MTQTIQTVGIIGAGTMGAGIAQVVAQSGYNAVLYDLSDALVQEGEARIFSFLEKGKAKGKISEADIEGVRSRLTLTTDLSQAACGELVIEAVPESMELKQKIFLDLDDKAPAGTILASNTSSLSITELCAVTNRPEQVAGLHFFNPVPLMKLVEIIRGQQTAEHTVATLRRFSESLKKVPAVAKDTPGFIVNRVARPFYGEALKILNENGQSGDTVKDIDATLKEAGGFKMGPFELMDLIGIDVNYAVTESVYHAYYEEPRYLPSIIQKKMVEAGHIGRKAGRGFYTYD